MEIFSSEQIRAWDEYTIRHEPVNSIDLMERAARSCFAWLEKKGYLDRSFSIYCGKGNNGGDGLALARLLAGQNCPVVVYILEFGHLGTDDFQINLARLHQTQVEVCFIHGAQDPVNFYPIPEGEVLIDAILGSGLNRKLEGVTAQLVEHLNRSGNEIIAIDIPTGLFVGKSSKGNIVIRATHTLSFQCFKPAFLVAENEMCTGQVHILDIGLHEGYLKEAVSHQILLDFPVIQAIFRPRKKFAHKGNFGHSLLVAGSYGKIGAAVLAGRACLRSGSGLLTIHAPRCGYEILQTSLPEAMIQTDPDERISTAVDGDISVYAVIGLGSGIGTDPLTKDLVRDLLKTFKKPVILDADALNLLASDPTLLSLIPSNSILTPHPKEFERLFGSSDNDFARLELASAKAKELQCVILLKGHYTYIAMPGGIAYFNSTGNPGMAKGGSGDVLTGILTALLSQGYSPDEAALFGAYLHGMAGDLAAAALSQQSMLPSDLTDQLGNVFLALTTDDSNSILPDS